MEELFDVCDEHGQPTGEVQTRSAVHRLGLWHRSAHLWLIDSRDRVLLQRRHPGKQTDPGRWDITAAGHLAAGQSPLEAMLREAHEELGLTLTADLLTPLTVRRKEYVEGNVVDKEYQSVFATRHDVDLSQLVLQHSEVVGVRWEPAAHLRERIEAADPSLVDRRGEWQEVFRFFGLFR